MNPRILLPLLIALNLAAAALIVEGLGSDEQDSGKDNRAWQVAEWNPGPACLSGLPDDDLARYWSSKYRQLNAMATDRPGCPNIH